MSLLSYFQWCEQSGIGDAIRNSVWLFPFIEAFHLVGLGLTAGAVLVVDLRLLGLGLRNNPCRNWRRMRSRGSWEASC